MDPSQPKFYEASFVVSYAGHRVSLRGYISETGITKVIFSTSTPEIWNELLGLNVHIHLEGQELDAILTRQTVTDGSFFEFLFFEIRPSQAEFIRKRIREAGVLPDWKRSYPRIPASTGDPELPVASLCLVRYKGHEHFVGVENFTLGGLRLEAAPKALEGVKVKTALQFDLLISTGEIIGNLLGEVKNIKEKDVERLGQKVRMRTFGIHFFDMSPENKLKYRNLIRDYCLVAKKRFFVKKP
jgi:hypothetical protein